MNQAEVKAEVERRSDSLYLNLTLNLNLLRVALALASTFFVLAGFFSILPLDLWDLPFNRR